MISYISGTVIVVEHLNLQILSADDYIMQHCTQHIYQSLIIHGTVTIFITTKYIDSMALREERKLSNYAENIRDCVQQLLAYTREENIINNTYLSSLADNIQTCDIQKSLTMIENSKNILGELEVLLQLEQKRRNSELRVEVKKKKNCVKTQLRERRKGRLRRKFNPYSRARVNRNLVVSSTESSQDTS